MCVYHGARLCVCVYGAATVSWLLKIYRSLLQNIVSFIGHLGLCVCVYDVRLCMYVYGVATIRRLLKIIGLSCRISSL